MLDLSHLPQTDMGTVECINYVRFFRETYAIALEEAGINARFTLSDHAPLDQDDDQVAIIFYAPFGTLEMTLPHALVDLLSDSLLPGWTDEDPEKLPSAWRAVYAFEQIARHSAFADMPCHIIDVTTPQNDAGQPGTLHGQVEIGGQVFPVVVSLRFGVLTELREFLPFPGRMDPDLDDVPLKLQPLALGPTTQIEAVSKISIGDVLILPGCEDGRFPLSLLAAGGAIWTGMCDENGNFTLSSKGKLQ